MNMSVPLGFVLLVLTGCSSPYISYPAVQEYVVEEASPGRRVLREAYPFTRQIRYARWYLGQIAEEFQAKHSQESGARAALLGATFAGAAGGAVAGAFGAGRDLLTGFAAGASGSATASSLFLDRGKAAAYRAGMRALDCIDTRARMQQAYYIELQKRRLAVSTASGF